MAQSQQFLVEFQEKMDKLANIRRNLQTSIQFKQQFTNDIKTKLGEINNKVKLISGLIYELKTKVDNLQIQVGEHTTFIGDKERQIVEINQRISNTLAEKDRVTQEFNEHRDKTQSQITEQQNKIDNLEAQLRDLTQLKETADNQLKALQAEIQAKGDQKDRQHTEEIAKIAVKNQQQLQEQEEELTQRINECEGRITDFQNQLNQKENEHQQTQQQLDEKQNQSQEQVFELQNQISFLTQENDKLIQRLIAATQAINEANNELETIVNSVPNAQTKQEVDALLNEITQQLEQSIENISRATQGQIQNSTLLVNSPNNEQYNVETNFQNLMNIHANNTQYGEYSAFMRTLQNKNKGQLMSAINQLIRNAQNGDKTSQVMLKQILEANKLIVKPPQRAGKHYKRKTTKKNRKQKGGFIYKTSSKRRSITSKLPKKNLRNSTRRISR